MTTTMRERFEDDISDIFYEIPKTGKECSNNKQKVLDFIEKELTKKDQEHKAELESIRQEVISNQQTNLKTESDPDWFQGYGYNQGLQTVSVILERHINKLSTE